ncbi:MAG: N-acetylmuramoyl-L-alanine amidase family protein [Acidobacteriaceae bacterium]
MAAAAVLLLADCSPSVALQANSHGIDKPALLPSPAAQVQPHFLVVLDAAHGGEDSGAHLAARLEEKDLVLTISVRLRSALAARGIEVMTTREADKTMPAIARAEIANRNKASACITLHATASGSGIHLFTSSLAPAPAARMLPWDAAQAPSIAQSLRLSSEINSAMTHAEIPVTLGRTSLKPLDNFACPAVAVEVAPLTKAGAVDTPLSDPEYQSRIIAALAAAIESWKRDWSVQP